MPFIRIRSQINTYIQHKKWYYYLPFWLFGAYLFFKLLEFELGGPAPSFFIAIAQAFDFVLHEAAHLVTAFMPSMFVAAAGSLAELSLGIILIITAFKTRSYFASLFCFLWFMLATQSVADYIADARTMALPLISFGGDNAIHDWHFILDELGLLAMDTTIASMVRGFGIVAGLFALAFSAWLLYQMAMFKPAEAVDSGEDRLKSPVAISSRSLYPEVLRGPLGPNHPKEDKK